MHEPTLVASKMLGAGLDLLPKGITVSFWIKVNEQPSATTYILHRKTGNVKILLDLLIIILQDLDVFALKINKDMRIVGNIANTNVVITTKPLPLKTWTLVTATFQIYQKDAGRSAMVSIYFWDTLQTAHALQALSNDFVESTNDEILIGGFEGVIASVSLVNSGQVIMDTGKPLLSHLRYTNIISSFL